MTFLTDVSTDKGLVSPSADDVLTDNSFQFEVCFLWNEYYVSSILLGNWFDVKNGNLSRLDVKPQ